MAKLIKAAARTLFVIIFTLIFTMLAFARLSSVDGGEVHIKPVLRAEFFRAFGLKLAVEESRDSIIRFPDYDSSDPVINGMINSGYVIGRTNGKLAAGEPLSLSDLNYFLERIEFQRDALSWQFDGFQLPAGSFPPLAVMIDRPVEIPVNIPVPVYEHGMFQLGSDGIYRCACSCGMPAPGQNGNMPRLNDEEFSDAYLPATASELSSAVSGYIRTEAAILEDIDNDVSYQIAVNAVFYGKSEPAAEGMRMGLIDFYKLYGSETVPGNEHLLLYELDTGGSIVKAIRIL